MSNPHRGGVTLNAGDTTYTLSFSVNAICDLEEQFGGMPVGQIAAGLEDPQKVKMSSIRALIWAGLRDHHENVSLKDAGLIASDAGVSECMDAIGRAFALAFPQQEAGQEGSRPRKAPRAA